MSPKSRSGRCQYCQELIIWAKHKATERAAPLDPKPAPNGNLLLDLQFMRYEVLTEHERERAQAQNIPLYLPHAATCTNRPAPAGQTGNRNKFRSELLFR